MDKERKVELKKQRDRCSDTKVQAPKSEYFSLPRRLHNTGIRKSNMLITPMALMQILNARMRF